jgi:hypothetical protein
MSGRYMPPVPMAKMRLVALETANVIASGPSTWLTEERWGVTDIEFANVSTFPDEVVSTPELNAAVVVTVTSPPASVTPAGLLIVRLDSVRDAGISKPVVRATDSCR